MMTKRFISFSVRFFLLSCTSVEYIVNSDLVGYFEYGKASFYAMKFQFRETVSGERLNQFSKTAAHRKLTFGTEVKVDGFVKTFHLLRCCK